MIYAYQSELFCCACAHYLKNDLQGDATGIYDVADTGDSDGYPQCVGCDEADSPQHCAGCDDFLENALTADGYDYVEREIRSDIADGHDDSIAITVWAPYYDIAVPRDGSLSDLLKRWSVFSPGTWENDRHPADWYAVGNDDEGIIAYFARESHAVGFRVATISRALNCEIA